MGKYALELKHGEEAEETFAELAELNGYHIEESTNYSNIVEHIDFYLVSKRGLDDFSVDVKARKKSRRNNTWYDDQMVWVEFHNVAGKKGWLYGEADKIAFERKNDFVIVDRMDLTKFCEKAVAPIFVKSVNEALYKIYRRKTRKDVISMVLMTDIVDDIENIIYWNKVVDNKNKV
tara:strand:+ start:594 stop:1121 length:528 start_codon:yes stop_codon:yes gene_type:complete